MDHPDTMSDDTVPDMEYADTTDHAAPSFGERVRGMFTGRPADEDQAEDSYRNEDDMVPPEQMEPERPHGPLV
jgi:hypothetical protein